MNKWLDELWDSICRIYMYWGGNCSELGPRGPDWIQGLNEKYQAEGPPEVANPQIRDAFLAELTGLENLLTDPDNSLSAEENQMLNALIANLRADMGVPS